MHNLPELIRWRGRVTPDIPALWFEGRSTSYAELDRRSNQVANALIARGICPGDRICVLDQNHDAYFELLLGIAKAGAVFVPVNWRLAPPELSFVVNDAEACMLFVGGPFCAAVAQIAGALRTVRHIFMFSGSNPHWQSFLELRDNAPSTDPAIEVPADETTWQLYTSGTTGNPKGAELTTDNLFANFTFAPTLFGGMREGDSALVIMPLYHIGGSGYALVALIAGCTLVVLREFDAPRALQVIQEQRVHHTFLVPAALLFLLQADESVHADFSSLKTIAYGASPIPEDLLRRSLERFGCEFLQVYGLTETTGAVTRLRHEDHQLRGPKAGLLKSCGQPLFGTDIRVVDPDGNSVSQGEMGEIAIRGNQIMKGYWHAPEATARAIRDGWFYSGDAGFLDENGYLFIQDRVKDMIVTGGENVYPAEVESCLFGHPAVADVAVIGVPDPKWGEAVKAIVVLKKGISATSDELTEYCKGRIASFKRPTSYEFRDSLPRNPTGKILKRELREPYWKGFERRVH